MTSLLARIQHRRRHGYQFPAPRYRAIEFHKALVIIDKTVPDELDVRLVCDNYANYKTPAARDWLARHPPVPRPLHPGPDPPG